MNLLYKLQQSFAGAWAIHEPIAQNYFPLVHSIMKGETKAFSELRASYQRPSASYYNMKSMSYVEMKEDDIDEDTLVVYPIKGVLMKDSGMCSVGTDDMKRSLMRLGDNENVKGVVLNVDSPGGSVDGTESFAKFISEFSSQYQKPIVAVMDGMTASAAMWIVSGTDRIFVKDNTTSAGSVGTLVGFQDWAEWEEKNGIKSYTVRATKSFNKAKIVEDYLAGDDTKLMRMLNSANDVFLSAIQQNRPQLNTSIIENDVPIVLSGEMFDGKDIIKMGLADQMGDIDTALKWIERESKKRSSTTSPTTTTKDIQTPIGATNNSNNFQMKNIFQKIALLVGITSVTTKEGKTMSLEDVQAELPELDMREDFIKEMVSKELEQAQTSQPNFAELQANIEKQQEDIQSLKAKQQDLVAEVASLKGQPTNAQKSVDGEIDNDVDLSAAEKTVDGQYAKKLLKAGAITKEQYQKELEKIAKG